MLALQTPHPFDGPPVTVPNLDFQRLLQKSVESKNYQTFSLSPLTSLEPSPPPSSKDPFEPSPLCYNSLFSFSSYFCFTCTFYYFFTPVCCTYPFTYAFHLLSSRLHTSPNHHAQPWWLHPFPDSFQLTFMYKYLRDSYWYFNSLLRNILHILFTLKPYQLVK